MLRKKGAESAKRNDALPRRCGDAPKLLNQPTFLGKKFGD